jgi:hypothetical protein
MKRAVVLSAFIALILSGPAAAQRPVTPPPAPAPEPVSRLKAREYRVAVRGCLQNKRLLLSASDRSDLAFDTLGATEFVLSGPRELMQQLQEQHNRHYDEVEGIVIVPPSPTDTDVAVSTKKVGPVRVGVGGRTERVPGGDHRPLTMKLTSLTHLAEVCAPQP